MRYRLYEVEERVSNMELDTEDTVAEIDDNMQLVLYGWWVYIPEMNVSLRRGTICIWDEEGSVYMPDIDVTVVYEGRVFPKADTLYYKQDDFVSTIDEWLGGSLDMDRVEQLWCELIISEKD